MNFERDARIIILGTFNDEPTNKSVLTMLNASNKRKNLNYRDLYNPFYDAHNMKEAGTVSVNGKIQMYDFIIVSPNYLKKTKDFQHILARAKYLKETEQNPCLLSEEMNILMEQALTSLFISNLADL